MGQQPAHTWPAEHFEQIADLTPGLITVYNIRTGKYTYVNAALKRLLGYEPSAFLKGGVGFAASIVHPLDLKRVMEKNSAALVAANKHRPEAKDGESIVNFEYRMRHANGRWVWLHTDGSVFDRAANGMVEHVLNVSIDITAAKSVEKKLLQLNRQLQVLSRAKDEFISIASHQLRTPATGIKLYIGMLLSGHGGSLGDEQRKYAQTAYETNERQIKIVNDLLHVARLDSGKLVLAKSEADMVQLVAGIVSEQARKSALKDQPLLFTTALAELNAQADQALLSMAIENIIDNASKYSPPGEPIRVTLAKDGSKLKIEVNDKGLGIAKKDHSKLFQKFSRIERADSYNVEGTGLGLYWAKKVIDLHGGTIKVTSRFNEGTSFTIYLPL
jgi:PAS domain S-box-containing protein